MKRLAKIQAALRAPKDMKNQFGGFSYRNAEGILKAVKPLLGDAFVTMNDTIVEIGGRLFLKATATITEGAESVSAEAMAMMCEHKGMSAEQSTGAASSYARKYALCGLFAIDDSTSDPDTTNDHEFSTLEELKEFWYANPDLHADKDFVKNVKAVKAKLAKKGGAQ